MKSYAMNCTKMLKLSRKLKLPRYAAAGIMECLWHLTARETPQGDIGKLENEDIAIGVDWDGDADALIAALVECRWLDESAEHRLIVHHWSEHSEDSVDMRLAREGLYYADGARPRMKRLSKAEKERIGAQYAEPCAHVRTNAQESALPLPMPLPKPINPIPPTCAPVEPARPAVAELTANELAEADECDALVRQIVCAHPKSLQRKLRPAEVGQAQQAAVLQAMADEIRESGQRGPQALRSMLADVRRIAAEVPREQWAYLRDVERFFRGHDYRMEPQAFCDRREQRTASPRRARTGSEASVGMHSEAPDPELDLPLVDLPPRLDCPAGARAFEACAEALRKALNKCVYETWFGSLRALGVADGRLWLAAPGVEWLDVIERYREQLEAIVHGLGLTEVRVVAAQQLRAAEGAA